MVLPLHPRQQIGSIRVVAHREHLFHQVPLDELAGLVEDHVEHRAGPIARRALLIQPGCPARADEMVEADPTHADVSCDIENRRDLVRVGLRDREAEARSQAGLAAVLDAGQRRSEAPLDLSEPVVEWLLPIERDPYVAQVRIAEPAGNLTVDPRAVRRDHRRQTDPLRFAEQSEEIGSKQRFPPAEQADRSVGILELAQKSFRLVRGHFTLATAGIGGAVAVQTSQVAPPGAVVGNDRADCAILAISQVVRLAAQATV